MQWTLSKIKQLIFGYEKFQLISLLCVRNLKYNLITLAYECRIDVLDHLRIVKVILPSKNYKQLNGKQCKIVSKSREKN